MKRVGVRYHDAAAEVVEDRGLELEVLSSDDGVGQGQLQEERLKHGELFPRSQTETLRRQTEGLGLPGRDGVGDGQRHVCAPRVSDGKNMLKISFISVLRHFFTL